MFATTFPEQSMSAQGSYFLLVVSSIWVLLFEHVLTRGCPGVGENMEEGKVLHGENKTSVTITSVG